MLEKTLALTDNDPKVMLLLAQRLFYAGQYQKLADLLKGIDPQSAMSKSALIAYRALALCEAGQPDQAAPMIDALADRAKDDVAASFAKGLRTRFARPAVAPQEAVRLYRESLLRDAGNAVVRYYLADSYAGLGEEELALKQLLLTEQTARNWAQPYARASEVMRRQGRFAEAQAHAIYAARCLPGDRALVSNVLVCRYYALDSTHPDVGKQAVLLLADVKAFNEKYPDDEPTLPLRVGIYAQAKDHKTDAEQLIREFIDRHQAAVAAGKPGFSQKLWLDLAVISRDYRLGADQELLQLADKTGGMTPELARQRGLGQYFAGRPEAGLEELKKIAEQQGNAVEYRIELARYLEWTNDRKARELWMALGDDPANAGNRALQCMVLEAPSLWPARDAGLADDAEQQLTRAFLQRTIDRVHALTSDDGLLWRMGRARLLMTSDSVKDKAEAVTTLVDIVNTSPYQLKAQRLLAQAQENIGNTSGAIEQLKTALAYSPDSLEVKLELARLLQTQGLNDDARRYLLQARDSRALAPPQRYQIALMLGQQGDRQAAIAILEALPTELVRDLMLAEPYAGEGNELGAAKLYEELLEANPQTPVVLQAVADYYAARGNLGRAKEELAKLPSGKPGEANLVRGSFAERFGDPTDALKEFKAATDAASADPRTWRALAGLHLRRNGPDQAAAAADAGLRHAAGNDDLAALKALAADVKAMSPRADLAPLVDALSRQPRDRAAQEAWQVLRQAAQSKHSPQQAADALKAVADRNPRALPVWMMLVNQYVAAGNLSAASETLGRMLQLFPTVPDVAELAVNVYAATDDPQKVLNAARQWRDRSLANPRRADLAIAEALCQMGNPAKAIEQLQPYIEQARKDLEANRDVVVAYTRALMLWGRKEDVAEVTAMLAPKLSSSPEWRAHWLQLANVGRLPADRASQWIDQAAAHIPADAPTREQAVLARAWYELARRTGNPDVYKKATDILRPLADRPDADARLLALYASSLDRAGQFDAAKSAYRRSLVKDPALHFAQNELAFLLLSRGTDADLPEALQLAQSATNAAPRQPAYKDTLARVYLKQHNYGAAVQWFQAALQDDPNNLETLVGLCQALVADKKTAQAADPLGRIDRLLPNQPEPDPALQAQIKAVREQLQKTEPSAAGN